MERVTISIDPDVFDFITVMADCKSPEDIEARISESFNRVFRTQKNKFLRAVQKGHPGLDIRDEVESFLNDSLDFVEEQGFAVDKNKIPASRFEIINLATDKLENMVLENISEALQETYREIAERAQK